MIITMPLRFQKLQIFHVTIFQTMIEVVIWEYL